jgi:hypothetical protein
MWDRSREWLDLEEGVSVPDLDVLQADATAPRIKPLLNNDFLIESKEEMKKRGVRSPDVWDSVALTFAEIERIFLTTPNGERKRRDSQRAVKSTIAAATQPQVFMPGGENSWMGI